MSPESRRARWQARFEAANQRLRRRFVEAGVNVRDAVPAFTGLYPTFGGYGNFEFLLTRSRILALVDGQVQLWSAATGPTPTRLLGTYPLAKITFPISERRKYDLVRVGNRRLWVHRRYREQTQSWITQR